MTAAGGLGQLDVVTVLAAIAAARSDDVAVVTDDRRVTRGELDERANRVADHLVGCGLGCHTERALLAPSESGQDHLGIYVRNRSEYLESMLGAWKARVAPFNVNYRYAAGELHRLLDDADATAVVVESRFGPTLAAVLPRLPRVRVVLQIADDSGHDLVPGARWYHDALAAASPCAPDVRPSADDLYILYTGGTTGVPKGVLWRNGDALIECFGATPTATLDELVAESATGVRALVTPPLMHGAGHWFALSVLLGGGAVHLTPTPFDPAAVWTTVERDRIELLLIVGDAFGRPLVDELARRTYDTSSLNVVLSGGAGLSVGLKRELLAALPTIMIVDGLGSSEAGGQLSQVSTGAAATSGAYLARPGNQVLAAGLDRVLDPGDEEIGWLAKQGRIALGYLHDAARTANTYPTVEGVRYAVPGDRARLRDDGTIEVCGRDAATINSAGEKVFAEEVEQAVRAHPAVADCVVTGRRSERWGEEVVAIVELRAGAQFDEAALRRDAARHIARYKLPKAVIVVAAIARSPAGKPDYRWARHLAEHAAP